MTNISLTKIGGVGAILAAASFIVAITVQQFAAGDVGPGDLRDTPANALLDINRHREAFLTFEWFYFLGPVLLIPAALGFYQALRQAGVFPVDRGSSGDCWWPSS